MKKDQPTSTKGTEQSHTFQTSQTASFTEIKNKGDDKVQITIDNETFMRLDEFFERMYFVSGKRLNSIQSSINKTLSDTIKANPKDVEDNLAALNYSNESILVIGQNIDFINTFHQDLHTANKSLGL